MSAANVNTGKERIRHKASKLGVILILFVKARSDDHPAIHPGRIFFFISFFQLNPGECKK
jgi:hypothetical protein